MIQLIAETDWEEETAKTKSPLIVKPRKLVESKCRDCGKFGYTTNNSGYCHDCEMKLGFKKLQQETLKIIAETDWEAEAAKFESDV